MSYSYLAIAYTGREQDSYDYSKKALAFYMNEKVPAFSPIVHGHRVSTEHALLGDWEFWKQLSFAMIMPAPMVHVLVPTGWEDFTLASRGVNAEISYAVSQRKHIHAVTLDGRGICRRHPSETLILESLGVPIGYDNCEGTLRTMANRHHSAQH